MSEHTKGCISVTHNNWEVSTLYVEEKPIAQCEIDADVDEETQSKFETIKEANATRLADCWNACEGLADPSVVPELIEALDELSLFHESGGHIGNANAVIAKARDTLAKARGETS